MAKVFVQVSGGAAKEMDIGTVADVKRALNLDKYSAAVNGEPVDDDHELSDYEVVTLAPNVKGGAQ